MTITPVSQNNFSAALAFLKKNSLPADDITETTRLFVLEEKNSILGTVGLEFLNSEGLLRSLSISEEVRGRGLGEELVRFIESFARAQQVKSLYLLTTTAAPFFSKRGFSRIDRTSVSPFISQTSEFRSVCPSSATVMKKELA